jgi:cell division protease FtsH
MSMERVAAAQQVQAAEATAREIDIAVRDLLGKAFQRAQEILHARRRDLEAGAQLLLSRETVTVDDFPPVRSARDTTVPSVIEAPVARKVLVSPAAMNGS